MKHFLFAFCLIFLFINEVADAQSSSRAPPPTAPTSQRPGPPTAPTSQRPGPPTARTTPYTVPTTTLRPWSYCYTCTMQSCPLPFKANGVPYYVSPNGWCLKTTTSMDTTAPAERTIDQNNYCYYKGYGCRWDGAYYRCCCKGDYCNTATKFFNFNSLLFTLSLVFIFIYNKNIF